MKRIILMDTKRGFLSIGFYLGIVLAAAAGVLGMGEMLEYIAGTILPEGEIRCVSAAYMALCSEGLVYSLPITCTLAMSGAYIEDQQSGALSYIILRTTKKRYHVSKMLSCAGFGVLSVLGAAFLILVIFGIMFPPEGTEVQSFHLENLGYLVERVLILCLNGSFFSLLGAAVAAAVNNRYMAYAAPFILYYVLSTLFEAYLSDFPLLNPKEWMLLQVSEEGMVTEILLTLNMVAAVCYLLVMERRWKYE